MKNRHAHFFIFFFFLLLTSTCPAQRTNDQQPKIEAVTTGTNGRGIPNGHSDTPQDYFPLKQLSADPNYGYKKENSIKVGGVYQGPRREKLFLNALRGPKNEIIEYERLGSCCHLPRGGMLDVFRVTHEGQEKPVILYLNIYEEAPLFVPTGFTPRKEN